MTRVSRIINKGLTLGRLPAGKAGIDPPLGLRQVQSCTWLRVEGLTLENPRDDKRRKRFKAKLVYDIVQPRISDYMVEYNYEKRNKTLA